MKKFLLAVFLLTALSSVNSQVKVLGTLVTNSPLDQYPTHIDTLGAGGFMTVFNISSRNAIPPNRRKKGMVVTTVVNNLAYQLVGGISNSDWRPINLNGIDSISSHSDSLNIIKNNSPFYIQIVEDTTYQGEFAKFKKVSTFAAMLLLGTPTVTTIIKVANDETHNLANQIYIWDTDDKINWFAQVEINH